MTHCHEVVVLEEIREEDGAQMYRFGHGITDVIWLCGLDHYPGARVGMCGSMVYESTPHRGRWRFIPHEYEDEGETRH